MESHAETPYTLCYDVPIPNDVAYCPYNGTYQDMINKAYELDDKKTMKALIEYRDDMVNRGKFIIPEKTLSGA